MLDNDNDNDDQDCDEILNESVNSSQVRSSQHSSFNYLDDNEDLKGKKLIFIHESKYFGSNK